MAAELKNEQAVRTYLMPKILNAVKYMFEQIDKFNEETINEVVYKYDASGRYERTMQFRDAWDYLKEHEPIINGDTVSGTWGFRYDMLMFNPEKYQHGSIYSGDVREYMAEIIYNGVTGSMFGDIPARNAWAVVTKYVTKKRVKNWIIDGLKKEGLKISKQE